MILNQVYSAKSGKGIGGGMVAPINTPPPSTLPAWRRNKVNRTWTTVPSNTLASINPENDPSINPNYPSQAEWHAIGGQQAIIGSWCGACWDDATGTLHLPLSGGHSDYAGNEPYKITLGVDAPQWKMLRPPSGAVGNVLVTNDGKEVTGVYADGRPRAIHSYNNHVYVPGLGPVLHRQGSTAWTGQTSTNFTWVYNETTGEAANVFELTNTNLGIGYGNMGSPYGSACWDSLRQVIWCIGIGTTLLAQLKPGTTWTGKTVGTYDNHTSSYASLQHVKEVDLILLATGDGNGGPSFNVFDPVSGVRTKVVLSGSFPTGFIWANGAMGMAWCKKLGCVLMWNNTSNTTTITTLTPGANWKTDPWTIGQLTVDASNSVTPTVATTTYTYGRFGYSETLQGCYLLNGVNQPIYFFTIDS